VQLAGLDDPVVTLHPDPTDGPVLITIRYRVGLDSYESFVAAAARRCACRRRTGAYRWGLFRDLADPELVIETYLVDSWAEHVRQHHRTTNTDLEVLGRARRHVDGELEISHYISSYSER
jgi:hypothetical protein